MKILVLIVAVVLLSGCAMGIVNDAQRSAQESYQVKQVKEVVCNQNLCQTTMFEGSVGKDSAAGITYDLQVNCANSTYRTLNAAEIVGNAYRVQTKPVLYSDRPQVIRQGTPAGDVFAGYCRK